MTAKRWEKRGKYVALSGGVGGAKLAFGLSRVLAPDALTIVANTGDDFEHLGLHISPDIDTLLYTLSGRNNAKLGWGVEGETWAFLDALKVLGGDSWFQLGDRDLATHIVRTMRLRAGDTLTSTTHYLAEKFGIPVPILPMTDDAVRTCVESDIGTLEFQRYFVREKCEPEVSGFNFDGIERARPSARVVEALNDPELSGVILCPSNPFVSIDPILSLPGMTELLAKTSAPIVAISPIVGGQALKGPAAKMMSELGIECTSTSVAKKYADILTGFVCDQVDDSQKKDVEALGLKVLATQTVMSSNEVKRELALQVLQFIESMKVYA
jgi:LPPG:FO 2-phospho-L-lactate transferase